LPLRRLDHLRIPPRYSKPSDFHPTFDLNQKSGDLTDNPSRVHPLVHDHGYNHDHKLNLTNLDPEIPDCIFNPNPGPDFYSSSNSNPYLGRFPSRSSSISPQASVSNSVSNSALGLSLSLSPELQRSCPSPCHCHHRHHRHSLRSDGSSSPAENKHDYSYDYEYDYDDSDTVHKRGWEGGIKVSDRT
jgi:hypothetical protein